MRERSHLRHWLFGLYVLVCLAAQTWPVYDRFGNSIEPYVLGLPWSLALRGRLLGPELGHEVVQYVG